MTEYDAYKPASGPRNALVFIVCMLAGECLFLAACAALAGWFA